MQRSAVPLLLLIVSCDRSSEPAPIPSEVPEVTPTEDPAPAVTQPSPPAENDEACARVVVVAWQGAAHADESVTRSEDEARQRADDLARRMEGGAPIADVARAESDAKSSGPRGGLLGTYMRDDWPAVHEPLRDRVFALAVGMRTPPIRTDYGFVIAERCPVEKVHTRHILVRYAGARNADGVTRSQEAARAMAEEIRASLGDGSGFEDVARSRSEDASKERGGDLGLVGRGRLAPEYEEAAFALSPGQISAVVETEFGFHVIQRVP